MMRPPFPCSIIWRAAACEQSSTPLAFTFIIASQVASSVSSNVATAPMPALLTRMFRLPQRSVVLADHAVGRLLAGYVDGEGL